MFDGEGLVGKGSVVVDTCAAGAVRVEEVATLNHEVFNLRPVSKSARTPSNISRVERSIGWPFTYNPMELTTLVALGYSLSISCLASAILAEILGRLGNSVCE